MIYDEFDSRITLYVLFKTVYYFITENGQGRVQYSGMCEIEFKRIVN